MTPSRLAKLEAMGQYTAIADEICDELETRFFEKGIKHFAPWEVTVYAVATFMGQMRDGGFEGYSDSPWGQEMLSTLPDAFESIGLPSYGEVVKTMKDRAELEGEEIDDDELEGPFWKLYYSQDGNGGMAEIDKALGQFICSAQKQK